MQKNYGERIAQASLDIEGIKLKPDDPFTWASRYRMPIYNDNRMLLGSHEHRMLVTEAFKDLVEKHQISFNYIGGTSTAGIAPATSVANAFRVPLLIMQEGIPYIFKQPMSVDSRERTDLVTSTCPWGIPFGITLANKMKAPFAYVRQKKKEHGLKQKIEGIVERGQTATLISYHIGEDYAPAAADALAEQGVLATELLRENVFFRVKPPEEIRGKKVLYIEDLISTGESSAKEVKAVRDVGAVCNHCLSIFSYGFNKAREKFETIAPGCKVDSVLTYDVLLEAAKKIGYLNEDQIGLLREWGEAPFEWGEKHGFPRVDKK